VNSRILRVAAASLVAMALVGGGPALAREVTIKMANGRVTLVAHNATTRQILEEWARQGHTRIVNVERVMGGPDSLELTDVPEARALATLLRSVAGYIAASRPTPVANLSMFDRILILPTSIATTAQAPVRPLPPQMMPPTVFEVPPDPTSLANDEAAERAAAPVFQGEPSGVPQPANVLPPGIPPTPALSPYNPPAAPPQGSQTPGPVTAPAPGQLLAPSPGVLPAPQQPQPPPQQPQ
jgi:hypothetical protein